jgi:hypothetical protein
MKKKFGGRSNYFGGEIMGRIKNTYGIFDGISKNRNIKN